MYVLSWFHVQILEFCLLRSCNLTRNRLVFQCPVRAVNLSNRKQENTDISRQFCNFLSRQKNKVYLIALDTLCSEFIFVTLCAIDIMVFGNKRFGANRIMTSTTNKTFFMPLPCLIFHLLHSCYGGNKHQMSRTRSILPLLNRLLASMYSDA